MPRDVFYDIISLASRDSGPVFEKGMSFEVAGSQVSYLCSSNKTYRVEVYERKIKGKISCNVCLFSNLLKLPNLSFLLYFVFR
jgi:hypothetical protein